MAVEIGHRMVVGILFGVVGMGVIEAWSQVRKGMNKAVCIQKMKSIMTLINIVQYNC